MISFDLTVTSLYPALLSGGQVELLAEDVGAQNLLAALCRQKGQQSGQNYSSSPGSAEPAIERCEVGGMTQAFVIGGENLPAESLDLWRDFAPSTRLI